MRNSMNPEKEGIPIYDKKYYLVGRKLIVIARDISKRVIPGSSRHRTQMAVASGKGDYAKCYIDIPAKIK
ncbi:hypothetical protein [Archaeoglobus sp. JdFR-39]|uniref:hypothetical protein n=1 Tax=Archaeoglobus sp. JdFR-39 TaxID=1934996 RepID=UPI0025BF70A8|nr:hypothetical protein [Archaeoglobus sp. JdFR-39]